MYFSWTDLLLVAGISQGFFLAIVLLLIKGKNPAGKRILSQILIVVSICLFGRLVFFRYSSEWVWRLGIVADAIIFLAGPLLYQYIRVLSFQEDQPYRLKWPHYLLPFGYLLYAVWSQFTSIEEHQRLWEIGITPIIYFTVEFLGWLSLSFYTFLAVRLYRDLHQQHKEHFASLQHAIPYLQRILTILSIICLLWFTSMFNSYLLQFRIPYLSYNGLWIFTSLFTYIIGYYSLVQPEIHRIPLQQRNPTLKKQDRLSPKEVDVAMLKLNQLIRKEAIYQQADLSLSKLATLLEMSTNDLSWLLNTVYKKSFYEFINQYRIEAFLEKIDQQLHKQQTLLSLAMDVGFNSKSTFNKSFKTLLNDTPSNYIRKRKAA